MLQAPLQAMRAASHQGQVAARRPRLLMAGATGMLGDEVMRRLAGRHHYRSTLVLAREPMTAGLRGVVMHQVPSSAPRDWPLAEADVAVVLFDPPRLFYQRERALWTPQPEQLLELTTWLRQSGVHTLAVVQPHAQGRLPEALKRGLASLDEASVARLGFERLLLVRSAQKPVKGSAGGPLQTLAQWMLSITRLMVPASEQPVRASSVAELVSAGLQFAPPGIHVAAPELVWQANQSAVLPLVRQWLRAE
jgi:hypothetical protein